MSGCLRVELDPAARFDLEDDIEKAGGIDQPDFEKRRRVVDVVFERRASSPSLQHRQDDAADEVARAHVLHIARL